MLSFLQACQDAGLVTEVSNDVADDLLWVTDTPELRNAVATTQKVITSSTLVPSEHIKLFNDLHKNPKFCLPSKREISTFFASQKKADSAVLTESLTQSKNNVTNQIAISTKTKANLSDKIKLIPDKTKKLEEISQHLETTYDSSCSELLNLIDDFPLCRLESVMNIYGDLATNISVATEFGGVLNGRFTRSYFDAENTFTSKVSKISKSLSQSMSSHNKENDQSSSDSNENLRKAVQIVCPELLQDILQAKIKFGMLSEGKKFMDLMVSQIESTGQASCLFSQSFSAHNLSKLQNQMHELMTSSYGIFSNFSNSMTVQLDLQQQEKIHEEQRRLLGQFEVIHGMMSAQKSRYDALDNLVAQGIVSYASSLQAYESVLACFARLEELLQSKPKVEVSSSAHSPVASTILARKLSDLLVLSSEIETSRRSVFTLESVEQDRAQLKNILELRDKTLQNNVDAAIFAAETCFDQLAARVSEYFPNFSTRTSGITLRLSNLSGVSSKLTGALQSLRSSHAIETQISKILDDIASKKSKLSRNEWLVCERRLVVAWLNCDVDEVARILRRANDEIAKHNRQSSSFSLAAVQ